MKDKVIFIERATSIDLIDKLVTAFTAAGIDTITKISFCSSYLPESTDETPMVRAFKHAIGRDPNQLKINVFRYRYHEYYAIIS